MHKLPELNYCNNYFDSDEEQNEKPKIRCTYFNTYLFDSKIINFNFLNSLLRG